MPATEPIRALFQRLQRDERCLVQSLTSPALAWLAWELVDRLDRTILCVTDGPQSLDLLYLDLHAFGGECMDSDKLFFYPGWEWLPGKAGNWSADLAGDRLALLKRCVSDSESPFLVAASVQALMQRVQDPDELEEHLFELRPGDEIELDELARRLESMGYEFGVEVLEKGEAVRRGGLLDLWPPDQYRPLRLDFFGSEIESIRQFDPTTQRSDETVDVVAICPARDAFAREEVELEADLFDFLPTDAVVLWLDRARIDQQAQLYLTTMEDSDCAHLILHPEDLDDRTELAAQVVTGALTAEGGKTLDLEIRPCEGLPHLASYALNPDLLEQNRRRFIEQTLARACEGLTVEIRFNSAGSRDRFLEAYIPVADQKLLHVSTGQISEGFERPGHLVIAESDLYGIRKTVRGKYDPQTKTNRRARHTGNRIEDWTDVMPGELVVHVDHGIGRYLGLIEIVFNGRRQEVLSIEYADDARIHLPVGQAHLLSRYVGLGRNSPRLHKLGGRRWAKEKDAAATAVEDLASNLLEVQAMRATLPGHACGEDTTWQHEFEATFPYTETVDQEQAILATKRDMESKKPMDRLICGDVGYGKTEVAMRAAFKAVMDGKQVAMLVPTTVLAQQHYQSFIERMMSFPVRIEMLSRFRTRKQQHEIVRDMKSGAVDIVIGTHRLLSDDIGFHDLGLVIVDEEQRFGVAAKESLKEMRRLVDVLTLTATPIPRTLYMSMTGARDMSTIQTAPRERQPVETIIEHWDEGLIRHAILRELNRGGQVFFLHNRVRTIEKIRQVLTEWVPEATIEVGHGQMSEHALEQVMQRFVAGEVNLLLCTTIIESGLDIPNANTIIIDRADRFGLAELYQLRGRVGRYKHKAYAYLLLPRQGVLTGEAMHRIRAIQRYTDLGSGFKLAMRDLEIRGAGNLLGANQSGHITAVGFDLYCQLLERTVKRLNGQDVPPIVDVAIKLDFIDLAPGHHTQENAAVIPFEYIEDEPKRIEMYRKLASVSSKDELRRVQAELKDRFGPFPNAVLALLKIAEIRAAAATKLVEEIEVRSGAVRIRKGGSYYQPDKRFPRLAAVDTMGKLKEVLRLVESSFG